MSAPGRILCASDLEKASERAFDRALSLARLGGARLFILHAVPAKVPFSSRAAEWLQYLNELRKRAEAAGAKVRVEEQHGDPAAGSACATDQWLNGSCDAPLGPCSSCLTLPPRVCSTAGARTIAKRSAEAR